MSIFQPYVGLTTTARKEWEKIHGKLSRNNVPNIMQDMLDISLTHLPQISGSLNQETITILLEMTHYLLSHKVYYVETALARSLMKTNINLQLSEISNSNLGNISNTHSLTTMLTIDAIGISTCLILNFTINLTSG